MSWKVVVGFAAAAMTAGCMSTNISSTGAPAGSSNSDPSTPSTSGGDQTPAATTPAGGDPSSAGNASSNQPAAPAAENPILAARTVDYGEALRTASLKLVGDLPTLDEMAGATDAVSYAAQIDKYLADPRFAERIRSYFRDMMKLGGTLQVPVNNNNVNVNLETAPTFATELVMQDRSLLELFTATSNTCPTMDPNTGTFQDASCPTANGQPTVGVLTDPGAMAQFFSNLAFRRTRWVQESFVCNKFPTEFTAKTTPMGAGVYGSPWPFDSISGGQAARVDFKDTTSVVCANCHSSLNHIAPLFANFDAVGVFQTSIQVHLPTPGTPLAMMSDWLPAGENPAWRFGKPAADLTALGQQMAADPVIARCQVARAWNWAMSKQDIVNQLAVVPDSTIAALVDGFKTNGYKLRPLLKAIFTADDFVKF